MRTFITICLVTGSLLLTGIHSFGQHRPAYSFKGYPATERYRGNKVEPKLQPNTPAWSFRTSIKEAASDKPNFAGHYVIATWGCGMQCMSYAIIDKNTGEVFCKNTTVCCQDSNSQEGFGLIEFRPNSKLIIFSGMLNEKGSNGAHYYKFEKGKLIALR